MEYLFTHWKKLRDVLARGPIFLFLDYDGTLAPLRRVPSRAVLSKETKRLLMELSRCRTCRVAVISGRPLKDVRRLVGVEGMIYAGNHGLEVEDPAAGYSKIGPSDLRATLRRIRDGLSGKLRDVTGAIIEDKGLTLGLHYRQVAKEDIPGVRSAFDAVTRPFVFQKKIRVISGKKVFEVRPFDGFDKGEAVALLLAGQQTLLGDERITPVYLGDDVTDEDAFRILKDRGITVFVGAPKRSRAGYYVRNIEEARELLRRILILKKDFLP